MTTLVACLSTGKGTWEHVARVIAGEDWEKIILITNEFGKENFNIEKKDIEVIVINPMRFLPELIEDIKRGLEGKIKGTEAALNMISGSGKEHMAVLSALLKLGFGVRLVALTKEGVREV
ncbi:hypothetical protein KY317_01120 [Candidatus Woesearchaeota archaeon]|nr:hypothetical protein [Candidatus Woesearchaeota archaeon]